LTFHRQLKNGEISKYSEILPIWHWLMQGELEEIDELRRLSEELSTDELRLYTTT